MLCVYTFLKYLTTLLNFILWKSLNLSFLPTDQRDYNLETDILTFSTGSTSSTTVCTAVHIQPDNLEEANETVVVFAVPEAPDVLPANGLNSVTITILNNDGKLRDCVFYCLEVKTGKDQIH